MRMFLKVSMDTQMANRAVADGSMAKAVEGFVAAYKPDGVWFTALDGKRTMVAIFDLASPSQLPSVAEPFFHAVGAQVDVSPAMDLADLQAGLSAV
jgi:hypothetical protein